MPIGSGRPIRHTRLYTTVAWIPQSHVLLKRNNPSFTVEVASIMEIPVTIVTRSHPESSLLILADFNGKQTFLPAGYAYAPDIAWFH